VGYNEWNNFYDEKMGLGFRVRQKCGILCALGRVPL
jgi:hypothetical protein